MIRTMLLAATLVMVTPTLAYGDQTDADRIAMEKAGVTAAEKWLDLVDRHNYAESWSEASAYFRNAVAQQEWAKTLEGARTPLGKVVSRTLDGASYQTSLPGAPDGEYVIVKFHTEFQHKKEAVETVVPMKEDDGIWRVSGYFIR